MTGIQKTGSSRHPPRAIFLKRRRNPRKFLDKTRCKNDEITILLLKVACGAVVCEAESLLTKWYIDWAKD